MSHDAERCNADRFGVGDGEAGRRMTSGTVSVSGRTVNAAHADLFYDGGTGEPITDAEWDKSKARLTADNDHLIPEEFRP